MSEHEIQQRILLACGSGTTRLWRNNVGTLPDRQGRPVRFGLCKGSSDLIGLRSITIGPEHVGQTLAVFAAVEVKSLKGPTTTEQRAFIATVAGMGGLAGVARSVEDAAQILRVDRGSMQNPN
jgi:hypothetical protein